MSCIGRGRAIAFALDPEQAHELPMAHGLLKRLPARPLHVVCNRAYASRAFRDHVWTTGPEATLPPKRTDPPVRCDSYICRNVVERL